LRPTESARIAALGLDEENLDSVRRYASELSRWGRRADVEDYLAALERIAAAEDESLSGSRRLVSTVAKYLYRLTAYKDEYEVARLMTDEDGLAAARRVAGGGRISWRLHPPLLRALGLKRKISVATWATPGIRLLAHAKFLRGTPFDIFGYAEIRRVERVLACEYLGAIESALVRAGGTQLPAIVAMAALPDQVRGYEEIKLARIAIYRGELDEAMALVSDRVGFATPS